VETPRKPNRCGYKGRRTGSLGRRGPASAFIKSPLKILGACGRARHESLTKLGATRRPACRILRNHGQAGEYVQQASPAGTARPVEMQASILLVKLAPNPSCMAARPRQAHAAGTTRALRADPGIMPPTSFRRLTKPVFHPIHLFAWRIAISFQSRLVGRENRQGRILSRCRWHLQPAGMFCSLGYKEGGFHAFRTRGAKEVSVPVPSTRKLPAPGSN